MAFTVILITSRMLLTDFTSTARRVSMSVDVKQKQK